MQHPSPGMIKGCALALLALLVPVGGAIAGPPDISGNPPAAVLDVIRNVEAKPAFAHSSFGIYVADMASGEVLIDQASAQSFVPGSIMKVYSTATALNRFGPDYRF